jgi:hypothetical protein
MSYNIKPYEEEPYCSVCNSYIISDKEFTSINEPCIEAPGIIECPLFKECPVSNTDEMPDKIPGSQCVRVYRYEDILNIFRGYEILLKFICPDIIRSIFMYVYEDYNNIHNNYVRLFLVPSNLLYKFILPLDCQVRQ